jgi:DNA-binding GntR family transcriptional regulator
MRQVLRTAGPVQKGSSRVAASSLRIDRFDELLRDRVVAAVRNAIVSGELTPGTRLIERELVDQTGVSRTSVREALRHLQSEGLVEPSDSRGLRVAVLTEEDVGHLYEVREALESTAARLFVTHATDDEVEELARIGKKLCQTSMVAVDIDKRLAAVLEFDEVLRRGARNPILSEMLSSIAVRSQLLRRLSMSVPGRAVASAAEYEALVEAIRKRSKRAAGAAAAAHVASARAAALKALRASTSAR